MRFYIIPTPIAIKYQGFQKENFAINFTETNKGIWVINLNCGEDIFTELDWSSFELIELTPEDFIPTYEDKPLINGYRLLGVFDTYKNTIDIHLFKDDVFVINRPYVNDTWTDQYVENYINEL